MTKQEQKDYINNLIDNDDLENANLRDANLSVINTDECPIYKEIIAKLNKEVHIKNKVWVVINNADCDDTKEKFCPNCDECLETITIHPDDEPTIVKCGECDYEYD